MRTMKPLSQAMASAWLVLASVDSLAQSQNDTNTGIELQEVVVTATRGEKAIEKIPGAVSVVNQKELATQYQIADDPSAALSIYVPGYAPSRQKMTSFGESFRGRQPLILLDGIPQSNPLRAGAREGYFADTAIIERIEVISGASAIHGMGATGGIINYITKTPRVAGTNHTVSARLSSQFRSDSLDWKTGYMLTHKSEVFDMLGYVGIQQRGIGYDGDGRTIGLDAVQGDTMDSDGKDLFIKLGKSFGDQRLQLMLNRFKMEGDGDYRSKDADFAAGIPTTSVKGTPPGEPPRNKVESASLDYRHANLAGGMFTAQVFKQDFQALYGASDTTVFQDPNIAPRGTLFDQSEIVADKKGVKLTYIRPDVLVRGLEVTVGADYLEDETEQRLALTDRTWVPPLKFTSKAPFIQLEYEKGPFTVRGGLRREFAELAVDTYTTLAFYGSREVTGGTASFSKTVKNLGAVWRFAPGWSVFASSSEGFGLPDAGLILRGVNSDGRSVGSLLAELQPVVTHNKEVGVTWRGNKASVGLSYYDSRSDLSTQIRVVNNVGRIDRVPTHVKGWELVGDYKFTPTWALFGSYAITRGKTAATQDAPLDLELGARSQGPDKLVLGTNWQWAEKANMRLQAMHLFDRDINEGRRIGRAIVEEHFNGYTLVDLAVSWQSIYGQFGFGIENILDKQYIGYYPQSASANDADSYFAGRGRTFSVSWAKTF